MVAVSGCGVLLRGRSGGGKSDLALGLIDRGHRLVADDLVEFTAVNGQLTGSCRAGCAGFIELHGLGIVNLTRLYGGETVAPATPLALVITLADDERDAPAERLHCQRRDWSLLGVSVPEVVLPCGRGRDLPLLVETAVRLNRLWQQGYDATAELERSLATLMREESA